MCVVFELWLVFDESYSSIESLRSLGRRLSQHFEDSHFYGITVNTLFTDKTRRIDTNAGTVLPTFSLVFTENEPDFLAYRAV